AGHQLGWPGALEAMAFHVVQIAVIALGEPLQQLRLGRRQVHPRDSDAGEAQRLCPGTDLMDPLSVPIHRVIIGTSPGPNPGWARGILCRPAGLTPLSW